MVVKRIETFKKIRQAKKNNKPKKYILRGQSNAKYYEKILSNIKESYNVT